MPLQFGTSGLRGLARDFTPEGVARWVDAYLAACGIGAQVFLARDLRASSPMIAGAVRAALAAAGRKVVDLGALPTPALAFQAMAEGAGAIMVTGSHIPADRNGLKFYRPDGEIDKASEAAMRAAHDVGARAPLDGPGVLERRTDAAQAYLARYAGAFGSEALAGMRIGVWAQSSVARDLLPALLRALGAEVIELARAGHFYPVDTEAVSPETRTDLARWCAEYRLDALVSTDADGDRPLLMGGAGQLVAGDSLGVLTARALGAEVVCTPVSANSMIEEMGAFRATRRSRIGSPYVIAEMQAEQAAGPQARVVGFEPNGGFLLGFEAVAPAGPIAPLMTRDAVLPLVTVLVEARRADGMAALLATLPARATAADRLRDVQPEIAHGLLDSFATSPEARAAFFAPFGPEQRLDQTDGLRVTLTDGRIVHLRASGNAPEFRVYTEAATPEAAEALLRGVMAALAPRLAA